MVVCNALGRLSWLDILKPFFARRSAVSFPIRLMCDGIHWNIYVFVICGLIVACLHSVME